MAKQRILITGANGFVGSKIIERLVSLKKYQVCGLVRKTSDLTLLEPFINKITLYYGDIRFKESLLDAFKKQDIVIHTASHVSDWGNYSHFHDINVKGAKNVAELCMQNSVKHLIHFSSISIYGFGNRINAAEKTEVIPNDFYYCKTKLLGEETIRHFIETFNLCATIIQPGLIFGPNDRTMSYKIIDAIKKYSFGLCNNGRHLLSPLFIDNLIQALLLIILKPKKSLYRTYIITDNLKITWYEFTKLFCDHLKKPMPWLKMPGFMAISAAFLMEKIHLLLHLKNPPLITRYRISLIGSDFHFLSKKIVSELGYKPDQNIQKNIKLTIESYISS